eukprot:g2505.t1
MTIHAAAAAATVIAMMVLQIALVNGNNIQVVSNGKLCSRGVCADSRQSTIGAEIRGVENFSSLTDLEIAKIRGAMVEYGVIYFHGAAHLLTPETQLEFAERFGHVLPDISTIPAYVKEGVHQSLHSVRHEEARTEGVDVKNSVNTMVEANTPANKFWDGKAMPSRVARLVREPGDPFAFGEGFHADVTFFQEPPFFTFLVARELPGGMDDTVFIDVAKAYDTLPSDLRNEITGLNAVHNDSAGLSWEHPVVRTHPESGRQAIYVNSHFCHRVSGYDQSESRELLDKVFDHIELGQPKFRFKWTCECEGGKMCPECNHVLMWDNRRLQHTATTEWARDEVLGKKRRELHRVTISGNEAPFYRPIPLYATPSVSKTSAECEL